MNRLIVYVKYVTQRLGNIHSLKDMISFGKWFVKGLVNFMYARQFRKGTAYYRDISGIRVADDDILHIFADVAQKIGHTADSMILDEGIRSLENAEFHVPIIDILEHNPSEWIYHVNADDIRTCVGARAGVGEHLFDRNVHHVEYVADDGAPLMEQCKFLLQFAARGIPVHIRGDYPELERHLGHRIYAIMRSGDIVDCDLEERELHSVSLRREALRNHGLYGRLHRMSMALERDLYQLPVVSIVVATKRPEFVRRIIGMIDLQTYPNREVILALHGEDFEDEYEMKSPGRVVNVSSSESLGNALQRATVMARGELIAKMDDDDLYDIEHIWDLVLAYQYSSARLVSKTAKYYYFADSKEFRVGSVGMSEAYNRYAIGPTLLIDRRTLDGVGGWPDLHHGEELALSRKVRRSGHRVYRTHGLGYICMRYGAYHEHASIQRHNEFDLHLVRTNTTLRKMGFSELFLGLVEHERFF